MSHKFKFLLSGEDRLAEKFALQITPGEVLGIGRESPALGLRHPSVEPVHFHIQLVDGQIQAEAPARGGGEFIHNGYPTRRAEICPGDRIGFGVYTLEVLEAPVRGATKAISLPNQKELALWSERATIEEKLKELRRQREELDRLLREQQSALEAIDVELAAFQPASPSTEVPAPLSEKEEAELEAAAHSDHERTDRAERDRDGKNLGGPDHGEPDHSESNDGEPGRDGTLLLEVPSRAEVPRASAPRARWARMVGRVVLSTPAQLLLAASLAFVGGHYFRVHQQPDRPEWSETVTQIKARAQSWWQSRVERSVASEPAH